MIQEALLKAGANNLTLVRLVLAGLVMVSHCYWRITGREGEDWFSPVLGAPVSSYAVNGFFFLSGFLVYRSLQRRAKVTDFMTARLARMFPGLAVAVLLTVAVGAFAIDLPLDRYLRGETQAFIVRNLTFLGGAYSLTGLPCDVRPCAINGSLWTLPWEFRCYLLLAGLALIGLARPDWMRRLILPATLALAIAWSLPGVATAANGLVGNGVFYHLDTVIRFWSLFAAGIASAVFITRIRLSIWVLLILFAGNVAGFALGWPQLLHIAFVGYAVLYFGFATARRGAVAGNWPDYSYGLYIYAFPTMIAAALIWDFDTPAALLAVNIAMTVPLAMLSWHLIESPALNRIARSRRRAPAADEPQPSAA